MARKRVTPHGSWKSPITSDSIVAGSVVLDSPRLDGEDIYWVETRPQEKGRSVVVMRRADGRIEDLTPAGMSARTRVHEYGGGALLVHARTVYFSNFADQRLYRQAPGSAPEPLTPGTDMRYADGVYDAKRRRIVAVREDHTRGGEAMNEIVALPDSPSDGGDVLVSGSDFVSSPRLSPDCTRLAWLQWNHPNMPWDGTELWIAGLDGDGRVARKKKVAGGIEESVFQPEFSPDGVLYFVSDRTGWWNLYRCREENVEAVTRLRVEFGKPQWSFGLSTYAFESERRAVVTYGRGSGDRLALLDTRTRKLSRIPCSYTDFSFVRAAPGRALLIAGSPSEARAVVLLDLGRNKAKVLRRSTEVRIQRGYISLPRQIAFPTTRRQRAHALYYAPRNQGFAAPQGEKPPLLVMSHGGPTAAASSVLNPAIQYWTSRGFAVLDVDYGGSSGYGRAYRERLRGKWGIVDVDDCCHGALYLARRRLVDKRKLAIRGGSAGGFTTLAALARKRVFRAGASYYGVSDLEALARETHKFESRYLDRLVAPYPARKDLYEERSPIHHVGRLDCPVIFFQGLEDEVVPPNQSKMMFDALRKKGIPTAYLAYEGEQHGFRRAENIKRSLDAELYFYGRVFGFAPADGIEEVEIENL